MVSILGGKGNAIVYLLGLLASVTVAAAQDHPGVPGVHKERKAPRHIDGARNPELLPERVVWDGVFAALHDFLGYNPEDAEVGRDPDDFIRSNLFLSSEDGRILKRGVQRAREAVQEKQDRLDDAFRADQPQEQLAELKRQVDRATLDARDELLRDLSPRGAKALLRWVAVVKYGMSYEEAAP